MADHYWYTEGKQAPVEVELMAHGRRAGWWRIKGPGIDMDALGDNIHSDELEAWQVYLRWIRSAAQYLTSFGIDCDFFVMKDLDKRFASAKGRIEELELELEERMNGGADNDR